MELWKNLGNLSNLTLLTLDLYFCEEYNKISGDLDHHISEYLDKLNNLKYLGLNLGYN